MSRPVAADVGFNRLKVTDGQTTLSEASAIAPEVPLIGSLTRDPALPPDLIYSDGMKSWLVGDLAVRQTPGSAQWSGIQTREDDPVFSVLLAAGLIYFCPKTDDSFSLVTGLPVSQYLVHKRELETWLTGRQFSGRLQINGRPIQRTVTIDQAKVWPQPYGSHLDLLLDDNGDETRDAYDSGYREAEKIIADIGGGTVDILAIKGSEPRTDISHTHRGSMNDVYTRIGQELGVPGIEIERAYLAGDDREVEGKVQKGIEELGRQIGRTILSLLNPTRFRPQFLVVTGGPAEEIADAIDAEMQFERTYRGRVLVCRTPSAEANVRGFMKAAKRLYRNG